MYFDLARPSSETQILDIQKWAYKPSVLLHWNWECLWVTFAMWESKSIYLCWRFWHPSYCLQRQLTSENCRFQVGDLKRWETFEVVSYCFTWPVHIKQATGSPSLQRPSHSCSASSSRHKWWPNAETQTESIKSMQKYLMIAKNAKPSMLILNSPRNKRRTCCISKISRNWKCRCVCPSLGTEKTYYNLLERAEGRASACERNFHDFKCIGGLQNVVDGGNVWNGVSDESFR